LANHRGEPEAARAGDVCERDEVEGPLTELLVSTWRLVGASVVALSTRPQAPSRHQAPGTEAHRCF
jgi:hypothetical protein